MVSEIEDVEGRINPTTVPFLTITFSSFIRNHFSSFLSVFFLYCKETLKRRVNNLDYINLQRP